VALCSESFLGHWMAKFGSPPAAPDAAEAPSSANAASSNAEPKITLSAFRGVKRNEPTADEVRVHGLLN